MRRASFGKSTSPPHGKGIEHVFTFHLGACKSCLTGSVHRSIAAAVLSLLRPQERLEHGSFLLHLHPDRRTVAVIGEDEAASAGAPMLEKQAGFRLDLRRGSNRERPLDIAEAFEAYAPANRPAMPS